MGRSVIWPKAGWGAREWFWFSKENHRDSWPELMGAHRCWTENWGTCMGPNSILWMWMTVISFVLFESGDWQRHQNLSQVDELPFWSLFTIVEYLAQPWYRNWNWYRNWGKDLVLPEGDTSDLVDSPGKVLPPLKSSWGRWKTGEVEKGGTKVGMWYEK